MTHPRPILIAGPTASGKSALALQLAEKFDGVVINADSMQVYRELNVLTARPSADDTARAPHKLYGFCPASEAYSAARFVADASEALAQARVHGQVPIVVGGTGLYFKALLEGLSPVPKIPDDIREHWRALAEAHGAYALWTVLMHDDPEMALRLDPNDGQRIVRALEVYAATGVSLAEWQRRPGTPVIAAGDAIKLVLETERDDIYVRASKRFAGMVANGGLEEARSLLEQNLPSSLPAMRAIGVRPLMAHIQGNVDFEAAIGRGQIETRQYIKRQMTWLKKHMIAWNNISTKQMESIDRLIFSFIQN